MSIVGKQLSAAVDQRDHAMILQFVRLYPPLGLEEEGLQAYIDYLKKNLQVLNLGSGLYNITSAMAATSPPHHLSTPIQKPSALTKEKNIKRQESSVLLFLIKDDERSGQRYDGGSVGQG
ncbi:hypothetical protein RJ639_046139 [Escallonia herrerae]|uniref:Uncharacterized protein n=1 Tax=Escallonia herrerae TaxID=1293975 RepID=A0AA88W997_9ASTE|nr:hypothetical protein RJ639_046139 [Escallonia herrerae]